MSSNFYYLKRLIPLDCIYEIKYFTKRFQTEWIYISNEGFCPVNINYKNSFLIFHSKNDSQFREMITQFEIKDRANNNPMNILNLLNSQFNLKWKE